MSAGIRFLGSCKPFFGARYRKVTAPGGAKVRKNDWDDLETVQSKKAAKLLMGAYRKLRVKSWAKVGERYGLTKTRAYRIAHETLRPNAKTDVVLMRAIARECDAVKRPAMLRRFIRKIAVPFLESRQRSRTRLYARGGQPWQGW
jgi:hypothetical protein